MTWPDHLLSLDDFERLPEDDSRRYELQEGVLHVTPKAASLHQRVVKRLAAMLDQQLNERWEAVPDVEVVLAAAYPSTLRVPDVVIAATDLIDQNPNRLHAQDVVLAVEVISPGSSRMDRVYKLFEYAKAGIPFYWVVELGDPVSVTAMRLDGETYDVVFDGSGEMSLDQPFPLHLDLPSLARRRGPAP